MRTCLLWVLLLAAFISINHSQTLAQGKPTGLMNIGSNKQLFIDNQLIESLINTKQTMNLAVKAEHNPIIRPDRPWEGSEVRINYAIYDEKDQIFKMWYSTMSFKAYRKDGKIVFDTGDPNKGSKNFVCFATSKDGIHWEKPSLRLVEFEGSKNNNIVPKENFKEFFFQDLHEKDPAKRYKGLVRTGDMGKPAMRFDLYFSSDAFHWVPYDRNPVIDRGSRIGRWGPTVFMGWDDIRQTYAVHMENCFHLHCSLQKRLIGRAESPDMLNWSEPETIIVPDKQDPADMEFYYLQAINYEGLYVGLLSNFRTSNTTILPQVVFSRDGINYNREYRYPIIQQGATADFDSVVIYPDPPLVYKDQIFIYYTGANWRSDESIVDLGEKARGAIGLAVLPLDGFVSLDAPAKQFSEVVTRSFIFSGSKLYLNMVSSLQGGAADPGEVKVEILGPGHIPLPAFGLQDCDPVTSTGLSQTVSWKGNPDVSKLAGQPIKLRIYFKHSKLYAFQFK